MTTEHTEEHGRNEDLVSRIREPVGPDRPKTLEMMSIPRVRGARGQHRGSIFEVYRHFVLLIASHNDRSDRVGLDRPLEPEQDILTESRDESQKTRLHHR